MDDCCEWTEIKLVHEIIADLQSLQGAWVEWMTMGEPDVREAFAIVSFYPHDNDGKAFRLRLEFVRADESGEFDRMFD